MVHLTSVCGAALSNGLWAATGDSASTEFRWWVDVTLSVLGLIILAWAVWGMVRAGHALPRADEPTVGLPAEYVIIPLALFMMVHGGVAMVLEGRGDEGLVAQMASAVAAVVVSAVIVLLAARGLPGGARQLLLGSEGPVRHLRLGIAGFLVAVPVCWGAVELSSFVLTRLDPDAELPAHQVLDLLEGEAGPAWAPLLLWFNAVLSAPIVEELFFRGLCQPALARALGGRWRGLLVTAILFGVVHAAQPQAVLPMVLLGALLGVLYARTGGVLAPMTLHMCFNLKTMILFSSQ